MNIEDYLKEKIRQAVKKCDLAIDKPLDFALTAPKQKEHGDLATNIALILASQIKNNPRQLAKDIVNNLHIDKNLVTGMEIAGPGFINFTLSKNYLYDSLRKVLNQKDSYGIASLGEGKKVQVEFVSANPTGPLTIGHGRQAVLGDTIARFLEAVGYDVNREYYFNDAGRQMRILAESVQLRYKEMLGKKIQFPSTHYQGEYIRDIAQKAVDEKGEALIDTNDLDYFQQLAEKNIFEDIVSTLKRMGIHFDVFYNEKSLYETGKIDEVVDQLKQKDLAYEKDNALWIRLSQMGREEDRVMVKSTGEPTYRLPDIAYHCDKIKRGFDKIIDIFGADHADTYPDVLAAVKALGFDTSRITVLVHQFVTLVEKGEKVKMSTRKANFTTLDELLNLVGEDVTRYFFVNRSMSSHLNFDIKLAQTQSEENPVYYVQYAHARICSIIRYAGEQGYTTENEADLSLLTSAEETALIKELLNYPDVVQQVATGFEPQKMTTYLEGVATAYHKFQHAGREDETMRVVTENAEMTCARLALCQASRIVLANGLTLLGISKPEKM
ncbi:MAG: arginine--tRNA ligase [bacterium]